MADYQISFFKNVCNSHGHTFRCLQDQFDIRNAATPDEAAMQAKERFAQRHHILNWQLRADAVDVAEMTAPPPLALPPRARIGASHTRARA